MWSGNKSELSWDTRMRVDMHKGALNNTFLFVDDNKRIKMANLRSHI